MELLKRTDKWQLGSGGTLYAPQHPQYLDVPGFWDEVLIGGKAFSKLLCVSFVLEREGLLIELDPYLSYWYWYPNRIEARYYLVVREGIGYKQQAGVRVFMDEVRRVLPDGTLHVGISFDLLKEHPSHLHVVAWGVNSQLTTGAGEPPLSHTTVPAIEPVVPKLAHTQLFNMLQTGVLSGEVRSSINSISALHWRPALNSDAPQALQVKCMPHGFNSKASAD